MVGVVETEEMGERQDSCPIERACASWKASCRTRLKYIELARVTALRFQSLE